MGHRGAASKWMSFFASHMANSSSPATCNADLFHLGENRTPTINARPVVSYRPLIVLNEFPAAMVELTIGGRSSNKLVMVPKSCMSAPHTDRACQVRVKSVM